MECMPRPEIDLQEVNDAISFLFFSMLEQGSSCSSKILTMRSTTNKYSWKRLDSGEYPYQCCFYILLNCATKTLNFAGPRFLLITMADIDAFKKVVISTDG